MVMTVRKKMQTIITKDMVKRDCVILDIGITKIKDENNKKGYRLVGDCDYDNLVNYVDLITPVPGGVGPLTITMLMKQTIESANSLAIT